MKILTRTGRHMERARGVSRRWIFAGAAVVLALIAGLAPNAGRILVVDAPQRSDVILVLAGETEHRPARALELLGQGYGPRVLIDVPATARLYGSTQVELARDYVKSLPQAASVDICPTEGLSTKDEAHDAEGCLGQQKGSSILIVTSDFHTRRALSIFRHEVRGKSFSVAAAHDETQFGIRWWTHRQWAKTCLDEWLRLAWWEAVERWY
jgi:uncharacterized SAM-binding protein YcdF (DUF218 family)